MNTKREFGQLLFIVGLSVMLMCGSVPGKEQCENESRSNPVVQMHQTLSVSQENPAIQSGVVKPGDRVTVTGSPARIGWGTVIVPSRIQSGGQTLHLRDETGKPLWLSR